MVFDVTAINERALNAASCSVMSRLSPAERARASEQSVTIGGVFK